MAGRLAAPVSGPDVGRPASVWYALAGPSGGSSERVVHGILGDAHPDSSRVTLATGSGDGALVLPAGDRVVWTARGRQRIRTFEAVGLRTSLPPPWFVLIGAQGPAERVALVAFVGGRTEATVVLDEVEAEALQVDGRDQIGAVDWEPATGVVRQLFVQPAMRRQRLGTLLVLAASGVQQFHGWPGTVRADGGRTDMGESFVAALPFQGRIAPWTRKALPMDVRPHPGP